MTIRKEIFLIALIFLLTISLAFVAVISVAVYRLNMDGARQRISGINQQIAAYVEAHFEGLATTVNIMAANPDVIAGDRGSEAARNRALLYFRFVQMSNSNVKYCYSGYDTGELLINDYEPPEGFDPTIRPWYTSAEASYPAPSIGVPYQEIKDREWLISVSKAFFDEARGRGGVVAIDSTLSRVDGMLNRIKSFDSQINYVVDDAGIVQVYPDERYLGKPLVDMAPEAAGAIERDSGFLSYPLEGQGRMAYYTKIHVANWTIVSAIDLEEVLGPTRFWIVVIVLIVLGVAAGLGVAQMKVYESRFVKPLVQLKSRVSEITSGMDSRSTEASFSNPELASIAARIEEMTETSLSRQARELALILESTSEGIIVTSGDGTIIRHNRRFLELWRLSGEERIREGLDAVAGAMREAAVSEDAPAILGDWGEAPIEGGERRGGMVVPIRLKRGSILEQDSQPLMEGGIVSGRLWSYKDITEKLLAEEKLREMATTDFLTGLFNRRQFMATAEYEFEQAHRYRRALSIAELDIDHFKDVNDNYGHAAGDEALRFLALSLKARLRAADTVGRIGGEEFAILLPNTDAAAALAISEKICAFFQDNSFEHQGRHLNFTVSIGVATLGGGETSVENLIGRADQACYAAKAAGRNRARSVDGPASE